jgi:hypothetical protein
MMPKDHLEVVDTTGLTDADWAQVNRLKAAYDAGGPKAFSAALHVLDQMAVSGDAVDALLRVMSAFPRGLVREALGKQKLAKPAWLQVIVNETDDEAVVKEKKEKALAKHIAAYPEDAGRAVHDFKWIVQHIIWSWPKGGTQEWRDALEAKLHPAASEEARVAWTSRAREVLAEHVARHPEDAGRTVADFPQMIRERMIREILWSLSGVGPGGRPPRWTQIKH